MPEFEDKTGEPPSARDIDDAIAAALKLRHPTMIMKISPEIAVNTGNIHRCLLYLKSLIGRST